MVKKLYQYRFELLLFSQLSVLFGSLVIPSLFFESLILPILFLLNVVVGMLFISKRKVLFWVFSILLVILISMSLLDYFEVGRGDLYEFIKIGVLFPFYIIVTYEIISQVWLAKKVNKNVILGLISGYISLGLVGTLLCMSIEMAVPGSFSGLINDGNNVSTTGNLLYYSYITLLTIGYGDILPVTMLAKKSAVLIGLGGQFYLVIVTAVVIEKYIRHRNSSEN